MDTRTILFSLFMLAALLIAGVFIGQCNAGELTPVYQHHNGDSLLWPIPPRDSTERYLLVEYLKEQNDSSLISYVKYNTLLDSVLGQKDQYRNTKKMERKHMDTTAVIEIK
jgi:hypothetical protein